MVLISDGDDNQSRVHPDEAIKMCERAETIIYAISTNWTPSRGKGDQVLNICTAETGGATFFPPISRGDVAKLQEIEEELRSQYALTYTPADFKSNGAFRPIYLYCNDRRYMLAQRKAISPHATSRLPSSHSVLRTRPSHLGTETVARP